MRLFNLISTKIDQLNIKPKLLVFLVVPVIALLFVASNQIVVHYDNYAQAQKSSRFINISTKIESVILALQQERGISEAFIGSNGALYQEQMYKRRLITDQSMTALVEQFLLSPDEDWTLEALNESISFKQKFKYYDIFVEKLHGQRQAIDELTAKDSFEYFTKIISDFIEDIESIQFATNSIGQLRLVNQFTDILWLQEFSGLERGKVSGLITANSFNFSKVKTVSSYIASQDKLLQKLLSTNNKELADSISQVIATKENKEITEIRKKLHQKLNRDLLIYDLKVLLNISSLSNDFSEYIHHKNDASRRKLKRDLSKARIHLEEIANQYVIVEDDTKALRTIEQKLTKLEDKIDIIKAGAYKHSFNIHDVIDTPKLSEALHQLEHLSITLDSDYWWGITTIRLENFHRVGITIQDKLLARVHKTEYKSVQSLIVNLVLILFTISFSLLLSYFIFKRVAGEMGNISTAITRMKQSGNFDQKLIVSGNDEIAKIATSYNELLDEREDSERKTRISAAVFEYASEAILITDANNNIQLVNPAFTKITGYTLEEVKGKNPRILKSGRHNALFYKDMWESLKLQGRWQSEIWNKRKNGEIYPQFIALSAVKDENNNIAQHISMFSDITQYKQYEKDIWYQANHDVLTELPNRSLFLDRLKHEIEIQPRFDKKLTVMFIDLDRFKYVNDTYGHSFGDELLITIANRLSSCLRKSDTVSRFGGDEFVVMSPSINDINEVKTIALKILKEVAKPVILSNGQQAIVSASIGITICPDDAHSVEELIKHADTAMYQAKDEGKNTFCFYLPEMNLAVTEQMQLELELRQAIENKEFTLHFQPVLSLSENKIVGAEALIRWNHPTKGMIYPDAFIPRAEETGLIVEIGEQVLEQAALAICLLNDLGYPIHVAVNVSGRQCLASNKNPIEKVITDVVRKYDLDPNSLKIEITESMLIENSQHVKDTLQAIKDIGLEIYMDDFGTGFSSLSYLKQFPIDVLKIDRSFIWKMLQDEADANLVEAIVMIGRSLDLSLVAEGVETNAHLAHLQGLNCEYAQGYHISRPVELNQLITFLNDTTYSINTH